MLGRNGAGKTTFFNCLNEDMEIDSGEFFIEDNQKQRKMEPEDIGYVLSTPNVPEFLTAREFLKFFIDINKKRIKTEKTIDEYFDFIKIEKEDRDRLLKDYSHGMKNKMQMLVNIIANPGILLLDEPLTSFDVVVAEEMKQMLREIKKDHIIIFSTHIIELALLLYLSGGTDNPINYAILFISIIAMSVFFSVHYLVMYYLLQPYNVNTEMKSSTYNVVQGLTYIVCWYMIQIKLPIFGFGIATIVFCIAYSLISLFLAYKYAPKTFRLRI